MLSGDEILFADEAKDTNKTSSQKAPWKVLIVDDDSEVHSVTQIALKSLEFLDKSISFINAYSSAEAKIKMEENPDTALILLDVVMETNDAGFQVVKHVRETLKNRNVRIVLRTGQPGYAPEKEVIVNFDINDYKAKSELTTQKLYSCVITSLRSYDAIKAADEQGKGLEQIVNSSTRLFECNQLDSFYSEVLQQLSLLLNFSKSEGIPSLNAFIAKDTSEELLLQTGFGMYNKEVGMDISAIADAGVLEIIRHNRENENHFGNKLFVGRMPEIPEIIIVITSDSSIEIDPWKVNLVNLFLSKASTVYKNVLLSKINDNTQEAAILSLARLAEYKDNETGDHIKRVEKMAMAVAKRLYEKGVMPETVDKEFVKFIGMASILHDVGKVGISDRILLKKEKLTEEEFELIKQHTIIGGAILADAANIISGRNYLSMAAEIAEFHHEKFSGGGYPDSLQEGKIPLSARLVAVVDVFDALTSKRPYKDPWTIEQAVELIKDESGKHFDPVIVDTFLELLSEGNAFKEVDD